MTEDKIKSLVQSYSDVGWKFVCVDDFPPPHIWIKMMWDKETKPILPK